MRPLSRRASTRVAAVAVALTAATVLVGACSDPSPTPSPPAGAEWVDSPFFGWGSGYETFCNHGNRIYGGSGGGVAVSPADPSCKTP